MLVLDPIEDRVAEAGDPLLDRARSGLAVEFQLLEAEQPLGVPVDPFDERTVRARPPGEPGLEPVHRLDERRRGIARLEEAVFHRRGHDPDGLALAREPLRCGRREGDGTLTDRGQAVAGVVDLAFGKDHERMTRLDQNLDPRLEGPEVGPFAVDREDAEPRQDEAGHSTKKLVSGQVSEGLPEPVADLEEAAGIGPVGVIRRDQDAIASAEERFEVFRTLNVDLDHVLLATQDLEPVVGSADVPPEPIELRRVEPIRELITEWLPVHWGGLAVGPFTPGNSAGPGGRGGRGRTPPQPRRSPREHPSIPGARRCRGRWSGRMPCP